MNNYRDELTKQIKDKKHEFEILKYNIYENMSNLTPDKLYSDSSYFNQMMKLQLPAIEIFSMMIQLRSFDKYNSENKL